MQARWTKNLRFSSFNSTLDTVTLMRSSRNKHLPTFRLSLRSQNLPQMKTRGGRRVTTLSSPTPLSHTTAGPPTTRRVIRTHCHPSGHIIRIPTPLLLRRVKRLWRCQSILAHIHFMALAAAVLPRITFRHSHLWRDVGPFPPIYKHHS